MQSIINLYARKHVVMETARIDLKIAELTRQLEAARKLPVVAGHENDMKAYQAFLAQVETFIKQAQKVREKVESKNIGLDFGFFGNSLTGSFDVFQRDTKDMLGPKIGRAHV